MAKRKRSIENIIEFPEAHDIARPSRLLAHRLREARLAKQMTQSALAEVIGVTRQSVSAYEAGDKSPEPPTFSRITDALGQPPSFFTTDNLPLFGEQKPQFFRQCGPKTLRKNIACKILERFSC
jgi:transcriptional regulator with XRE-family HTH domain